jgi:hypothetical protein
VSVGACCRYSRENRLPNYRFRFTKTMVQGQVCACCAHMCTRLRLCILTKSCSLLLLTFHSRCLACDPALFWPLLPPSLFAPTLSLDVSRHLCQCWRSTARRYARLRDGCRAHCPAREKVPFPLLCPLSVPFVRSKGRLTASYWDNHYLPTPPSLPLLHLRVFIPIRMGKVITKLHKLRGPEPDRRFERMSSFANPYGLNRLSSL